MGFSFWMRPPASVRPRVSREASDSVYRRSIPDAQADASSSGESGKKEQQSRGRSGQDVNQRLVDSALELYQKSQEFWDRGDLESALNALDESYALIVRVDQDVDEGILQQKEDLRYTIAKRIMEVYASRLSTAQGTQDAIPMVMNKHVEAELASFKGRERNFSSMHMCGRGDTAPTFSKRCGRKGCPRSFHGCP